MGTRGDFYIEKEDKSLEWLGSIGWDAYPDGITCNLLQSTNEEMYRQEVTRFITDSRGTFPDKGWPWPWEDSTTTDYSYVFREGKVWGSNWGHPFFDPLAPEPDDDNEDDTQKMDIWPNMKAFQKVATDPAQSGIFIIGG